ncbi:Mor transcription activator family protein [compost metagenome]
MDWLRAELGGQLVYFPKHRRAEMDERAAELYDRHWQGASIYDLVQEFKLSVPHVYQLLAQERQRRRQERDAQADATHQADRARWRREA